MLPDDGIFLDGWSAFTEDKPPLHFSSPRSCGGSVSSAGVDASLSHVDGLMILFTEEDPVVSGSNVLGAVVGSCLPSILCPPA